MAGDDLLEKWQRLHDIPKDIFGWPDWRELRQPKSSGLLRSQVAQRSTLLISLSDKEGINLENIQARITIWKERPNEDVTCTLEAADNNWTCISRMDFWSNSPHTNLDWKSVNGLPPRVGDTHYHRFKENKAIGSSSFKPNGNLRAAIEFDIEPKSFRDILRLIETEWNIEGASDLPLPGKQGGLNV
ncbi:hypothetical protein [Brucella pseudintermedia]|uniref:hypothetical protein n=1 Tax=Brucella pseudintermedia TaxID=370111 RepID=UPI003209D4E9